MDKVKRSSESFPVENDESREPDSLQTEYQGARRTACATESECRARDWDA